MRANSRDEPVTRALNQRAERRKIRFADIANVENGQVQQLDDGEHHAVISGEAHLVIDAPQLVEDAP